LLEHKRSVTLTLIDTPRREFDHGGSDPASICA